MASKDKQTGLTAESLMKAQQQMIESGKLSAEQLQTAKEQLARLEELVNAFKAETVATERNTEKTEKQIETIAQASKDVSSVRDEIRNLAKTIEAKDPKSNRAPLPQVHRQEEERPAASKGGTAPAGNVGSKSLLQKIGGVIPGSGRVAQAVKAGGGLISDKILGDIEKSRSPTYDKFMDLMTGKPNTGGGATARVQEGPSLKGTNAQIINITARSVNIKGAITGGGGSTTQAPQMSGSSKSGGRGSRAEPALVAGPAGPQQEEGGGPSLMDGLSEFGSKGSRMIRSAGRGLMRGGRGLLRGGGNLLRAGGRGLMSAGRGIGSTLAGGAGLFAGIGLAAGAAGAYFTGKNQQNMYKAAEEGDAEKASQASAASSKSQMGAFSEFQDPIQQQEAADKEAREALKAQASKGNKKAEAALKKMDNPMEGVDPKAAAKIKAAREKQEKLSAQGISYAPGRGTYVKENTGLFGSNIFNKSVSQDEVNSILNPGQLPATNEKAPGYKITEKFTGGMSGIPVSDRAMFSDVNKPKDVGMTGIPTQTFSTKKSPAPAKAAPKPAAKAKPKSSAAKQKDKPVVEETLMIRKSSVQSSSVGMETIPGYEYGYTLMGKAQDVRRADALWQMFKDASFNNDENTAKAASKQFVALADLIQSPEYQQNLRDLDAKQKARDAAKAEAAKTGGKVEGGKKTPSVPSGRKVGAASADNAEIKSKPATVVVNQQAPSNSNTVNNTTNNIMPRGDVRPNESAMERYANKNSHFM